LDISTLIAREYDPVRLDVDIDRSEMGNIGGVGVRNDFYRGVTTEIDAGRIWEEMLYPDCVANQSGCIGWRRQARNSEKHRREMDPTQDAHRSSTSGSVGIANFHGIWGISAKVVELKL